MTKSQFKKEKKRILELFKHPSKKRSERTIKKARKDFFTFCKLYLPHYFSNEIAPFQHQIIDLLQSKHHPIAIAAPRGFSKSTLVSFAFVIWVIINKSYRFIVIISATDDLADDLSQFIRLEFGDNPKILQDFGELIQDWGSSGDFIINETRVFARGRKQATRGFRHREHRPDLIILDDIEKDEEALSPFVVDKTMDMIHRALIPSLHPLGKLVAIGTILRNNSAFAKIIAQKNWTSVIFKALATDQKGNEYSLWENRFGTEFLKMQRTLIGISAFNAEYQNTPLDEGFSLFNESMIKIGSIPLDNAVMFIDPSLDGVKNGDFKVCVLAHGSHEKIEVLDIIAVQGSDREFFTKVCTLYQKYSQHISAVGLESNGFQHYFGKELQRFAENEQHIHLPIKPVKNYLKKELRIQKLLYWFETEKIVFSSALINQPEGKLLKEQLLYFPDRRVHDDIPDALAGAMELLTQIQAQKNNHAPTPTITQLFPTKSRKMPKPYY